MGSTRFKLDDLPERMRAAVGAMPKAPKPAATGKRQRIPRGPSRLEEAFALRLRAEGLPAPVREHRFHQSRAWRFDFAWPDRMLAVEIEGGVWTGGRHTRGRGFLEDCDKYNVATLAGWRVLRFAASHLESGEAAKIVSKALAFRGGPSVD